MSTRGSSLRTRTLFVVVLATTAFVLVICIPLRAHILDRFAHIEEELATNDLAAVRNTLSAETDAVGALARDYALWDASYDFVAEDTPPSESEYIRENFPDDMFSQSRLDLALIVRADRSVRYETRLDAARAERVAPVPVGEILAPGDEILTARPNAGILRTSAGLFIVGSHPILHSDASGEARGTMVLGRALSAPTIEDLAQRVRLALSILPLDGELPEDVSARRAAIDALAPDGDLLAPLDDDTLGAYSVVRDLHHQPVALIRVLVPRDVYSEGRADADFITASVAVTCLTFGLLVLLLLERMILKRVLHLSTEVGAVGAARDHSLRVSEEGTDELGALAQTVNEMLTSLERLNSELSEERAKAERLLRNVLPEPIANRLKQGERTIADAFGEVTVLFADIVGFTVLSSKIPAEELIVVLNDIFSRFDTLAERHGLEKIKTIGDAYMVVAGVPEPRGDHAIAVARMALDMLDAVDAFNRERGTELGIRIGIHSGPAVAGVIGQRKFIYDIWGDTVNTASRMESTGVPGRVQVSDATAKAIGDALPLEDRGVIQVKGKGEMRTWLLAERPRAAEAPAQPPEVQPSSDAEASPG